MTDMQLKVREFLALMGEPVGPALPAIRGGEHRARMILEEAVETAVGLCGGNRAALILGEQLVAIDYALQPDLIEAVDGCVDLLYVTLGALEAIGVDAETYFAPVHQANMVKEPVAINAHDKRGRKPDGWVDPKLEIARLLDADGWRQDALQDALDRRS